MNALLRLSTIRAARASAARHTTKVYIGMLPPLLTSAELLDLIVGELHRAPGSVRVLFYRPGVEGAYNRAEVHGVAYLAVMGDVADLIGALSRHVFRVAGPPAAEYRPRCFVAAFDRVARRPARKERDFAGESLFLFCNLL